MELIVCKDQAELVAQTNKWCQKQIIGGRVRSLFVPAGATPEALYANWTATRPLFLNDLRLKQIDDVLTGPKSREFRRFFESRLAPFREKIDFIDAADSTADAAILGLGLNGHVAFHEPEIPADFYSGCVPLSEETCQRLGLEKGTWGVTYGLGAFSHCQALLLMVSGVAKRQIFKQFLLRDSKIPASFLGKHPNLTVICDQSVSA